ncbi:MAG: rod shape-determining protein MreC [Actinobacteria bacterium]|nr:rod shape-determining protein MreC [Actinomycetota bacterium]
MVLLCLILTSVTLLLLDSKAPAGPLRSVSHTVLTPFQKTAAAIGRPVRDFFTSISDLSSLRERNDRLTEQNDRLRANGKKAADVARRLAQIEDILDLAGRGGYRVIAARVIAWPTGQDSSAAVTIDAGRADGLWPGMTVLTGRGLVGTTVTVARHTASVRLITDPDSHVGVRSAGTGRIGVTTGVANGADMTLQMLSAGSLVKQQILVTRGSLQGKPYVPGVPVGEVTVVTGVAGELPRGRVRPFVDLGALDVVGVVVQVPKSSPRDALVPTPRPTPTVTVTVTASPTVAPAPTSTPAAR